MSGARGATFALALLGALALGAACSGSTSEREEPEATAAPADAAEAPPGTPCEDPRPEMCAQIYDPVCALRDTGIRCVTEPCDSHEEREYPNGCEACRDPQVVSWRPGPCS